MKFSEKFIKANDAMCDFNNHVNAPYLRKKFNIPFKPEKAEITICGLGFYELYINGQNITKGPLAPYISNTDDVCYGKAVLPQGYCFKNGDAVVDLSTGQFSFSVKFQ